MSGDTKCRRYKIRVVLLRLSKYFQLRVKFYFPIQNHRMRQVVYLPLLFPMQKYRLHHVQQAIYYRSLKQYGVGITEVLKSMKIFAFSKHRQGLQLLSNFAFRKTVPPYYFEMVPLYR